jgi:hypothetical protein
VILFAAWTHYLVDWGVPSAGKTALLATIDALRNVGIRKIVVIGPAPVWKGGLPKLAYQAWKRSPFHTVPERLETGLDPAVPVADRQLERELASRQVTYFSLMDFFCTDAGCLTHLPESETRLVSWDAAHLTTDAAVLVAHKLAADGVLP